MKAIKSTGGRMVILILICAACATQLGIAGFPESQNSPSKQALNPMVLLTMPELGEKILSSDMVFEWELSEALQKKKGVTYSIKVVEIRKDQGPFSALRFNPPVIEEEGITDPKYALDGKMKWDGKKSYAWQIMVRQKDGVLSRSDVRTLGAKTYPKTMSRQEAVDIVVHTIVMPPTLNHLVTAFLVKKPFKPGDDLWAFTQKEQKMSIKQTSWFAWINDAPQAFFAHDTRFVFLDVTTGEVTVQTKRWWPVHNGTSLFMDDASLTDEELVIYSTVHLEKFK
jgi:hypothetical protein